MSDTQTHNSRHNTLGNGEWLLPGQSLYSESGKVELKMQTDGKLAAYREGKCIWQNTKEQRYDIKGGLMQADGNFCIYTYKGEAVWCTDTWQSGSTTVLAVQNDGNVVVYKGSAQWATNTGD